MMTLRICGKVSKKCGLLTIILVHRLYCGFIGTSRGDDITVIFTEKHPSVDWHLLTPGDLLPQRSLTNSHYYLYLQTWRVCYSSRYLKELCSLLYLRLNKLFPRPRFPGATVVLSSHTLEKWSSCGEWSGQGDLLCFSYAVDQSTRCTYQRLGISSGRLY